MTAASRTSGPAPLAVLFDATDSGTGIVQPGGGTPDFGTFNHQWFYGDTDVGTWTHTGRSRNSSVGFLGAHVYETPGTYTARLRVYNASGVATTYEQTITVTDPATVYSGETLYVSAAGNDSNPGTSGSPFLTMDHGLSVLFASDGPRRLLVNRGDTITQSALFTAAARTGPFYIGAYGSGARPIISGAPGSYGLALQAATRVAVSDLNFTLTGASSSQNAIVIMSEEGLSLRVRGDGQWVGITCITDKNCVQDCEILNNEAEGMYPKVPDDATAIQCAIMGTRFDGVSAGHSIRSSISKTLIAENRFEDASTTNIKMNAREAPNPLHHMCVMGNIFVSAMSGWIFEMGPQDGSALELVTDVLVEANNFAPTNADMSVCISVFADARVAIRNNIFDVGNTAPCNVDKRNPSGPTPAVVTFDHNTCVRRTSGNLWYGVTADSGDSTLARYNIMRAVSGSALGTSGTVTETGSLTTDPTFTNVSSSIFTLQSGSSAINAATDDAHVRFDFNGATRSVGAPDTGAYEYGASIADPPGDTPMASSDARPVPIKNTAFRVYFPILDADGDPVTGATGLDSEVSIDGAAFGDVTAEATEIGSSGIYYLELTSGEMNGDAIIVQVKTTSVGAKTTVLVFYPQEAGDIKVDVQSISGDSTAADNAESFFDGTGYAGTNNVIPLVTTTTTATTATNVTTVNGLAAGTITASVIADAAIDAASIATGAITAAKFAAGAIDAASLAADAGTEIAAAVLAAATVTPIASDLKTIKTVPLTGTGPFGI